MIVEYQKTKFVDKAKRKRSYRHGELKNILLTMQPGDVFQCVTSKEFDSVRCLLNRYKVAHRTNSYDLTLLIK